MGFSSNATNDNRWFLIISVGESFDLKFLIKIYRVLKTKMGYAEIEFLGLISKGFQICGC